MNQVDRIVQYYDQTMTGSSWHGDPIWQILEAISARQASQRPVPDAHTIWELLSHMTFWEGVAAGRLRGETVETLDELNFPAMPGDTEENWQAALNGFRESNQRFRAALSALDPALLDQLTARKKRTYYQEAHGLMDHHVYHAGQIALLKKIVSA